MSTLYLVRHGQARLFTNDYDRLSELGYEQAAALGHYWQREGVHCDYAWSGTLKRQTETAATVARVMGEGGSGFPAIETQPGFNEYPAEDIVASFGAHLDDASSEVAGLRSAFEKAKTNEDRYRHHHRYLEAVIGRWFAEDYGGFEPDVGSREWRAGVVAALRSVVATAESGSTSVIFTSGGVIATIVQSVLEAPPVKAAELNWRVPNASVTRFTFSGQRMSLDRLNDVAHLDAGQLTYR